MSDYKNVKVEDDTSGVRWVKVSRPAALNALNTETLTELKAVLEASSAETSVRVLVLTGEGEKAFIAGADIVEMKDKSSKEGIEFSRLGHDVATLLDAMPVPTIAAVNGFALGGGTEMAIACDFILAAENAVFGQPEVALGIIPGFGGTFRLAQHVGFPMAKDLIYSGRKIKATEAERIGLVNAVFSKEEFINRVRARAAEIASNSRSAVIASKRLLNEFAESVGRSYKIDAEAQEFGGIFGSHDQKEGMNAFAEKRKPAFEGLN